MRTLYSFPHRLGRQGIGTTAHAQITGLVEQGFEVTVICTSRDRPISGVSDVVETMAVAHHRLPHRAIGIDHTYQYHDWRVARALRRARPAFDVVHVWPLSATRTLQAARKMGVCGLREVPNTHTEFAYERAGAEASHLGVRMPRNHSHAHDERHLARELTEYALADFLLVPSSYVKQTFLDRGVSETKLALHRYGFDPERFPPPTTKDRQDERDGLIAVFVGSGEPRKGLHYALEAWIQSGAARRGQFRIYGELLPSYAEVLQAELSHPSVHVRGSTRDVGSALRQADVLILPSVEEGSALVTYEAQASGCVLLVSDATGALCSHPHQGLIHPAGDVATLTRHLRALDADRLLLARLRSVGLGRRDELSWRQAGVDLAGVYRECMSKR